MPIGKLFLIDNLTEVWFRCSLCVLLLIVVEIQYDQQAENKEDPLIAGVIRSEQPVESFFPKVDYVVISPVQSWITWITFKLISNSSYLVGRKIEIQIDSESRSFSSELHSPFSLELTSLLTSRAYFVVKAHPSMNEDDLPLFALQFQGGNAHISHIVCDYMSMLMTENHSNALQQFFRTAMIFLNTFFIDNILNCLQNFV